MFASFSQVVLLRAKTQAGAMMLVELLCPGIAGRGREITVERFECDGGGWVVTISNEMCIAGDTEKLSLTVIVGQDPS